MIIASHSVNLVNSTATFESAVKLLSANKYTEIMDIGPASDHLKTKITIWESIAKINELKASLPKVSETIAMQSTKNEYPFGPAYNCEQAAQYLLLSIGNIQTNDFGMALIELELAPLNIIEMQWACETVPFKLSKLAVKKVNRKTEESKTVHKKGEGYTAFRHGWSRPEISLTAMANNQTIGGVLRWLTEIRSSAFALQCNSSMMLTDTRQEITVHCTAWGNLQRIGNSGLWECDFEFVEAT